MNYRDVKLNDGQIVRVYMPPAVKISAVVSKKYPIPDAPIVEVKTVTGEVERIQVMDDPAYLELKAKQETAQRKETDEWYYLYALRDVKVPDSFDVEVYRDLALMENPDWQPRTDVRGRKLDYFEWELLGDPSNYNRIQNALLQMMSIDEEIVDLIEDSFRSDVAGAAA